MLRTFFTLSLPAIAVAVFAAFAMVQAPVAQSVEEGQSEPRMEWSEQELQSFASAALAVDEIFTKWRERIADAETAEEANAMQAEASTEAAQAVENEGLSIEEYNEINEAIQRDSELYDRVIELIQAEQG